MNWDIWPGLVTAFAAGGCIGSFIATAVLRRLDGQVLVGRSHCDGCQRPLSYAATLPVVAYIVRRGRCADCHGRIDPLHFVGEACGGAILTAAWLSALHSGDLLQALLCAALGLTLLAIALYDAKTLLIPNALTLLTLGFCILTLRQADGATILLHLAAAGLCFTILQLVRLAFRKLRGVPGLGFGDVKLLSVLALWLGPRIALAIALACLLGLCAAALTRPRSRIMPFGPWIACGAWLIGLEAALWS
jgi:leader peptidase (prepilin peptidase) / N-methyltransferase